MENDGKGLADFSVTAKISRVMEKGVFKRILTSIKLPVTTHLFLSP